MEIYPAVDLYQGEVVRLEQGDYSRCKVYSKNPAEIAERWVDAGARWLHVVDLEGAKTGTIQNWKALEKIVKAAKANIQFGGGVRRLEDIEQLLQRDIKRVILGSKALDFSFLEKVTGTYPHEVMLSLDLLGDQVQIEGWLKSGKGTVYELLDELRRYRFQGFVVTDIERDGTLRGLNLEKIKKIAGKIDRPMILSGGVSSQDDIRALLNLRLEKLEGIIIGKALYEERINLKEAFKLVRGERIQS